MHFLVLKNFRPP